MNDTDYQTPKNNPATGKKLPSVDDVVGLFCDTKPTGPWTAEYVTDAVAESGEKWLADAHNAALAAAYRAGASKLKFEAEDKLDQIGDLQQQLADERKRYDELEKLHRLMLIESNRQDEKVQTLVDALLEVNSLARGNMTGCGTCNHVIDATIKALAKVK